MPRSLCGFGNAGVIQKRTRVSKLRFGESYARFTDHVPMAAAKLTGATRFVATKVVGSPLGTPAFCRSAEIHFPSTEALQTCMASQGGQETAAHAISISTGGAPVFLIGEEETFTF